MTGAHPEQPQLRLPSGWRSFTPGDADVPALTALARHRETVVRGKPSTDRETVAASVTGTGSWTRWHLAVADDADEIRGWATVHDRASGRTNVYLQVCPDAGDLADDLAAQLLNWATSVAIQIGAERSVQHTQLDASIIEGDQDAARWYAAAGYSHTRTWLQMVRPVESADADLPHPREGVTVRRVQTHPSGLPVAEDVRAVHLVLEESFADHFNSYRESFAEFAQRLREDPGHRWDHWWLATVDSDEGPLLGGGLVSSVLPEDAQGFEGSYIDYIGVHRRARGRGVAKALLFTVIRDALERGRSRVSLEVDADSPTGADGLYESLGWRTSYRTQSWQRDIEVPRGPRTLD
ncbi:GNAT family N-acetyltransferase [Dermacoccaceae bacterium W4C1]